MTQARSDAIQRPLHGVAVAVAVDADGPLAGLLLLGDSGAGKSLTALKLIENCPWRRTALVADDAINLATEGGALIARAPAPLPPMIEVRGFGPAPVRMAGPVRIRLCLELGDAPDRVPEPAQFDAIPGASVLLYAFDARQPAPELRIRTMLRAILGGQS